MEKRPKVSVIMKCYNHEKFVGEAIESVLNQTYRDFEFLVADNGSTDRSGEIINSYADRIKVFKMEQNDPAECELMLWREAVGDYVAVICSDDWWEETKLEKQMEAAERMPECEFFFTWARVAEGDLSNVIDSERFVLYNAEKKKWFRTLFEKGTCFEASSILSKNNGCYIETFKPGGLKYRQLPDWASYFEMILNRKVYVVEEYLMKRRNHGNNVSVPNVQNVKRSMSEDANIRRYFLERVPDDVFVESFSENLTSRLDRNDPVDIMCNKIIYFISYAKNKWWLGQSALEFCWDHYGDRGVMEMLESKYDFTWQKLQDLSGEIGIGGLMQYERAKQENAGVSEEIRACICKLINMIAIIEARAEIPSLVVTIMETIFRLKVECDFDSAIYCYKLAMVINASDADEVWEDMRASLMKVLYISK